MHNATLVLGGGGFIGRRLIDSLQRAGRPVIAVSHNLDETHAPGLVQHRGSVEDTTLLRELLEHSSAVVYLASVTTPSASAREPGLEVTGNLLPLARFLEVAQTFPARDLLFISSAGAVYGECDDTVAESAALRPRSYYGAGKAASEALLHAFAVNSGWRTTILRPTNVYGPGQLPLKGFAIVPTIFRHILERRAFEIWGDGSVVRDYLFVDDITDLIARALGSPPATFAVYNAGSGTAVSVAELVRLCEQVAEAKLETVLRPSRKVDVPRVVPAIDAVAAAYDWCAKTDLRSGLTTTWRWLANT